jgi:hypothetical protein
MIKKLSGVFFMLVAGGAAAQSPGPQMADAMRQDGKIYVVISVIAIIFISLAAFLVYLERKVARLEKKSDNIRKTI